jgi:hypothetical protein
MDTTYILNPSIDSQDSIQTRGLDPNARDPHNYLKMVSKTFNAFKETAYTDGTISYIHGFSIDYLFIDKAKSQQYLTIDDGLKYIDPTKQYHLFRINPGACFIDDQFIEFDSPSVFLYELPTEELPIALVDDYTNPSFENQIIKLFTKLKYKIIIEYKWINELPAQKARIKFIVDNELENYDNTARPYLELGTFTVDDNGNVIASYPETFSNINEDTLTELVNSGELVKVTTSAGPIVYHKRGIDPQYLSKKYIENYKNLFKNIEDQLFNVFSKAGLGKSNFMVIEDDQIELGLPSGAMVYFDQIDKLYKPAKSSRQKTDRVIGLYLYDIINDTKMIFFNGLVDLDPDNKLMELNYNKVMTTEVDGELIIKTFQNRFGLTYNHPLVNLEPGQKYFLEDDSNYFTESLLIYNLDNYIEWDTRGFISTREYPASVQVGVAIDRTKLIINIDQSNEIDWMNAVNLYGNHLNFSKEYLNTYNYYRFDYEITELLKLQNNYIASKSNIDLFLGTYFETLPFQNIMTEDGTVDGAKKVFDTTQAVLPDYLNFLSWYLEKYITSVDYSPDYFEQVLFKNIRQNITLTEPNSDPLVIYLKDVVCAGDVDKLNNLLSTKDLKKAKSVYTVLLKYSISAMEIYNQAMFTAINSYLNSLNTQYTNELNLMVLAKRLELGDDPATAMEQIEDTTHNIIKDLGIKYTDENQLTIDRDQLIELDTQAEIDSRLTKQTQALALVAEINETGLQAWNTLNFIITERKRFMELYHKLKNLNRQTENTIKILEDRSDLLAQLIINQNVTIVESQKSKTLALSTRNLTAPKSLDIFYLTNHERKRFNYTYLVDRLKYEFSITETLNAEKIIITNKYLALNVSGANEYDKTMAEFELDTILKRIEKNSNNIKNYTDEINLLLADYNRPLIALNDKFFKIESDLINEDPNNFRFGIDLGPVGTNDERFIINEAFKTISNQLMVKLSDGDILRDTIPDRLIPSVYLLDGTLLTEVDFQTSRFVNPVFNITGSLNDLSYPYFYILLDNVKTLCYFYEDKNYIYRTDTVLPISIDNPDFNLIQDDQAIINNLGDIIQIIDLTEERFYVRTSNTSTVNFTVLEPLPLNNEEISRFVKEARVKSVSEDYVNAVTYVDFVNYFLNKERITKDVDVLNNYIDSIDLIEITDYTVIITLTLPTISSNYGTLITNTSVYYSNFSLNLIKLNELINILNSTSSLSVLTTYDVSDSFLIKYGLNAEFRTDPIQIRTNKLIKILDSYRTILYNILDDIKFEIKKFRDINVLEILNLNTELNN